MDIFYSRCAAKGADFIGVYILLAENALSSFGVSHSVLGDDGATLPFLNKVGGVERSSHFHLGNACTDVGFVRWEVSG